MANALILNVHPIHLGVKLENATILAAVTARYPNKSVRRLATQSRITHPSTYRTLRKAFHIFPSKRQCRYTIPRSPNHTTFLTERQREDFANEMYDIIYGSEIL